MKQQKPLIISRTVAIIPAPVQPSVAIPPQLKTLIQKERAGGGAKESIPVMIRSIEQAKKNELKAYLTLCQTRLEIPLKP